MYKLHAVIYPKEKYTYHQAYSNFTNEYSKNAPLDHYTNMPNFWRFTTINTKEFLKRNKYTKYITKKLQNGVELILVYKK